MNIRKSMFRNIQSSKASTEFATSQKQIFEIAVSFEAINSFNRSNSLLFTLDVVFIRMKNESLQCSFISSQNSIQDDVKIDTQKSSAISSSLSISTIDSTCEVTKKSATASIAEISKIISKERAESRTRTAYLFSRLKASRLNLSLNTFIIISETVKNASSQEVARAMCRSCKQSFNFNKKLFEHISEHEALKRINTVAVTFSQSVSSRCSSLQLRALNSASKSRKSTSIQRITCVRTTCKRCNQIFNFNNKFHEHIRQHHARKSVISKDSDLRVLAFEYAYKIAKKSTITDSLTSQFASSILFATSRNQIFESETFFKTITSSKRSNLTIATFKITSQSVKKLSLNCSFTSSLSSFRIHVRNLHESHISKSHLIMNDLSRMFHEKFKSFDLRQHHNRRFSSQNFDIRQSHFSSSSIKSHLTIENLFEMFDEKFKKKNLFQSQKNVSFQAFSNQMRIIFYFQFTVNRKSSISQNSKSSKSKNLNQHMFAKSIRIVFNKDFSEKSIDLSYKLPVVFCHLKSSKSRTFAETSFFIFMLLRLFSIFLIVLAFVSIISAARLNCINVYEQVVSIIDRIIQ